MDILYIHPTKKLGESKYSYMPIGITALTNLLLDNSYSVEGINLGIEYSLDVKFDLLTLLKELKYKILLVDLHWYEHSFGSIKVAEVSKQANPNIPVIIGGMTATIYANEILEKFDCVDYIIKGDGERPLLELVGSLLREQYNIKSIPNIAFRRGTNIVERKITYRCENFDELDYIPRNIFKNQRFFYLNTIFGPAGVLKNFFLSVARGCHYQCLHCGGAGANSKKLFGRSQKEGCLLRTPKKLVSDIKRFQEKGVQILRTTHDLDMFGTEYTKNFFDSIEEQKIDIGIYMESFQIPSKSFLHKFYQVFNNKLSTIAISPLSGDDEVRYLNGKHFDNEELMNTLICMANYSMNVDLFYTLNLVGDSMKAFESSLKQMEHIAEIYPSENLSLFCLFSIPDPLALIRKPKYGVITELNTFYDYYLYCQKEGDSYVGYGNALLNEWSERQRKLDVCFKNLKKKYPGLKISIPT